MARNLTGYAFNDAGTALASKPVTVYAAGDATGSQVTTTTTDSNGKWSRSVTGNQGHDIKIQSGSSIRWVKGNDDVQFNEVWVFSADSATEAPLRVDNANNNASAKVLELRGDRSSRADGDEIYISALLDNDAGEATEYGRITFEANDVSDGTEDGEIRFSVMKGGTLTDVWQIDASAAAAMSFDMNVDTVTFGSGGDTDVTLNFDANSNDGTFAWMEDEDLFQFSDDILMASTEKVTFGDSASFVQQSSDGTLRIDGEAIIDLNASTRVDVSGDLKVGGEVQTAGIGFTDGDNAITIADGGGTTFAQNAIFSGTIDIGHATDTTLSGSSGELSIQGVVVKKAGTEDMWVPAAAMQPTASNGCAALASAETTSGRPDMQVLDFDKDSDEFAQFSVCMPKSWNAGTVTFQAFWTTASTNTGTVAWGMSGTSIVNDATIDVTFSSPTVATADAGLGTVEDLHVSAVSGAITIKNAAASALTFFQILRDVSADSHTSDARLIGVKIIFTTNASTDA
jgi:hypothetical protein